jgi:hypothetical protein
VGRTARLGADLVGGPCGKSAHAAPTDPPNSRSQLAPSPPGIISTPPGCLGGHLSESHARLGPIVCPCAVTGPRAMWWAERAHDPRRLQTLHNAIFLQAPMWYPRARDARICVVGRAPEVAVGVANHLMWTFIFQSTNWYFHRARVPKGTRSIGHAFRMLVGSSGCRVGNLMWAECEQANFYCERMRSCVRVCVRMHAGWAGRRAGRASTSSCTLWRGLLVRVERGQHACRGRAPWACPPHPPHHRTHPSVLPLPTPGPPVTRRPTAPGHGSLRAPQPRVPDRVPDHVPNLKLAKVVPIPPIKIDQLGDGGD